LLVDGRQFFPLMLEAIAKARRYVLLEIYLFESGAVATRFIDAFVRAASHGVKVKLLLDDFGALGLSPQDRERLIQGGVELLLYNPIHFSKHLRNMLRDHRKLLIVDGEVAFVSGAGITDEFDFPENPEQSWRETATRIRGPVLVDWQELFVRLLERHVPNPLELPVRASRRCRRHAGASRLPRLWRDRTSSVRCTARRHAQHRVWSATAISGVTQGPALAQAGSPAVWTCGCCCPARTPITRRSATRRRFTPASVARRRTEYQPRFFARQTILMHDRFTAQATSTAGICAGTFEALG
jgi:phosphatidylserine/phosphatidylglycerophosphate/cardiolipin synthase-like enzyme